MWVLKHPTISKYTETVRFVSRNAQERRSLFLPIIIIGSSYLFINSSA